MCELCGRDVRNWKTYFCIRYWFECVFFFHEEGHYILWGTMLECCISMQVCDCPVLFRFDRSEFGSGIDDETLDLVTELTALVETENFLLFRTVARQLNMKMIVQLVDFRVYMELTLGDQEMANDTRV